MENTVQIDISARYWNKIPTLQSKKQKNSGNKPKKDVYAFEDFLDSQLQVVAAAIEFSGREDMDDIPAANVSPSTVWMLSQEERRDVLISVCSAIVEDFVDISMFDHDSSKVGEGAKKPKQHDTYVKEVLFGLLYKELVDAVREGDGLRVVGWWRYMLLIIKSTGCKNNSDEAFIMLAQLKYLLSPREKQQLLYSRFINIMHSLPSKNISCDLYNNIIMKKDTIRALGANQTPNINAIDRLGNLKRITSLGDIFDNFDNLHQFTSRRADHKVPSADKDMTHNVIVSCVALECYLDVSMQVIDGQQPYFNTPL